MAWLKLCGSKMMCVLNCVRLKWKNGVGLKRFGCKIFVPELSNSKVYIISIYTILSFALCDSNMKQCMKRTIMVQGTWEKMKMRFEFSLRIHDWLPCTPSACQPPVSRAWRIGKNGECLECFVSKINCFINSVCLKLCVAKMGCGKYGMWEKRCGS